MPLDSNDSETTFTIFYAWQSDLPTKTNRRAILNALNEAAGNLEDELGGRIAIDEATRGTSGSPNIPQKILEKIKACDAFFADVTVIFNDQNGRKAPNPNVTFELGYALAHLGWDRIVLLLNSNFGPVEDLPFDFDRHRASTYTFSPELAGSDLKVARAHLNELVEVAARAIIQASPKRPRELEKLSSAEVRRDRDIRQIRVLLSQISLAYIDSFIEDLPERINTSIIYFWTNFHDEFQNSKFHLYDSELLAAFKKLHDAWDVALSYDHHYRSTSHEDLHLFGSRTNTPRSQDEENAWNIIVSKKVILFQELQTILTIVRDRYLEIDVNSCSDVAYQRYVSYKMSLNDE